MDNCPVCSKKIMNHAKNIKCLICCKKYHMNCITLDNTYIAFLQSNKEFWYCPNCIEDSLPFVGIENDTEFQATINQLSNDQVKALCSLSDKVFRPFDLNEDDDECYMEDHDPDLNYFNILNHNLSKCKYYLENSFNNELLETSLDECVNKFSMFHINIRSVKSNLGSLQNYLELLNQKFSILAVTETWLKV